MEFDHDVFFSYASEDREWAMGLKDELVRSGVVRKPFFDRDSLVAGDRLAPRIVSALKSSEHFIVLWSSAAKKSEWVHQEIARFDIFANPSANITRRLIFVNMEGESNYYRQFLQIDLASLRDAYAGRAPSTRNVWHDATVAVADALNWAIEPLVVSVVVLTLTLEELIALPPENRTSIEVEFGTGFAPLSEQYGSARGDWRPLGGSDSIDVILDGIKREIEATTGGRRVIWREPAPEFWTDPSVVRQYVGDNFNQESLALLVIDPVAVHHHEVYRRLMCFQECLGNEETVIAVLPPFGVPMIAGLKRALLASGMPYFDDYFKPKCPPKRQLVAQCVWNACDADDIVRHLLLAQGKRNPMPAAASTFLTGV